MEKVNITNKYEAMIEFLKANGAPAEMVDFAVSRKDAHVKKNTNRKPTAEQLENIKYKEDILNTMEDGKWYTVTEIQGLVNVLSNHKASALMTQLKNDKLIEREERKGRAYFKKA